MCTTNCGSCSTYFNYSAATNVTIQRSATVAPSSSCLVMSLGNFYNYASYTLGTQNQLQVIYSKLRFAGNANFGQNCGSRVCPHHGSLVISAALMPLEVDGCVHMDSSYSDLIITTDCTFANTYGCTPQMQAVRSNSGCYSGAWSSVNYTSSCSMCNACTPLPIFTPAGLKRSNNDTETITNSVTTKAKRGVSVCPTPTVWYAVRSL